MTRTLAAVGLLVVGLVACSDGGADVTSTTSESVSTTDGVASTLSTTTAAAVVEEVPSVGAAIGLAEIELLTPATGGGPRPLLAWHPVDGAVEYYVVVRTPSGNPYWAWRTVDTSVPFGGLPPLDENAAGPSVAEGMTWSVIAVDTDANVIGQSNHRPISP